eukprot:CAMPEP_0175173280 /NCGR_PEP_ID=MMETSP0087-20121206/31954_1 /TAXON_ID=136419 /ORGANISM="Unknown Unknown, Strain D1" /LENGTH=2116 /DNA_ID=CAMNT_0016464551 /DNA_START=447 /DNA_END=6798 /DNA_ORIENTATION=+
MADRLFLVNKGTVCSRSTEYRTPSSFKASRSKKEGFDLGLLEERPLASNESGREKEHRKSGYVGKLERRKAKEKAEEKKIRALLTPQTHHHRRKATPPDSQIAYTKDEVIGDAVASTSTEDSKVDMVEQPKFDSAPQDKAVEGLAKQHAPSLNISVPLADFAEIPVHKAPSSKPEPNAEFLAVPTFHPKKGSSVRSNTTGKGLNSLSIAVDPVHLSLPQSSTPEHQRAKSKTFVPTLPTVPPTPQQAAVKAKHFFSADATSEEENPLFANDASTMSLAGARSVDPARKRHSLEELVTEKLDNFQKEMDRKRELRQTQKKRLGSVVADLNDSNHSSKSNSAVNSTTTSASNSPSQKLRNLLLHSAANSALNSPTRHLRFLHSNLNSAVASMANSRVPSPELHARRLAERSIANVIRSQTNSRENSVDASQMLDFALPSAVNSPITAGRILVLGSHLNSVANSANVSRRTSPTAQERRLFEAAGAELTRLLQGKSRVGSVSSSPVLTSRQLNPSGNSSSQGLFSADTQNNEKFASALSKLASLSMIETEPSKEPITPDECDSTPAPASSQEPETIIGGSGTSGIAKALLPKIAPLDRGNDEALSTPVEVRGPGAPANAAAASPPSPRLKQQEQKQANADPCILNEPWTLRRNPRPACTAAADLLDRLLTVCRKHSGQGPLNAEKAEVIQKAKEFTDLVEKLSELSAVLLLPLSHEERLSFYINAYNLLVLHATIVNFQGAKGPRKGNVKLYRYRLGDLGPVTAYEIEHACLRQPIRSKPKQGKARWGLFPTKFPEFPRGSSQATLVVLQPEPRIAFTLCTGKKGWPPIIVHHAFSMDMSLESATESYLQGRMQGRMQFNPESRVLHLPHILSPSACGKDVGQSTADICKFAQKYLTSKMKVAVRGGPVRAKFVPDCSSTNHFHFQVFQPSPELVSRKSKKFGGQGNSSKSLRSSTFKRSLSRLLLDGKDLDGDDDDYQYAPPSTSEIAERFCAGSIVGEEPFFLHEQYKASVQSMDVSYVLVITKTDLISIMEGSEKLMKKMVAIARKNATSRQSFSQMSLFGLDDDDEDEDSLTDFEEEGEYSESLFVCVYVEEGEYSDLSSRNSGQTSKVAVVGARGTSRARLESMGEENQSDQLNRTNGTDDSATFSPERPENDADLPESSPKVLTGSAPQGLENDVDQPESSPKCSTESADDSSLLLKTPSGESSQQIQSPAVFGHVSLPSAIKPTTAEVKPSKPILSILQRSNQTAASSLSVKRDGAASIKLERKRQRSGVTRERGVSDTKFNSYSKSRGRFHSRNVSKSTDSKWTDENLLEMDDTARLCSRGVLPTTSFLRQMWLHVKFFCMAWLLIVVPYRAAFWSKSHVALVPDLQLSARYLAFDYVCEALLLIDVVLNLRFFAFYDERLERDETDPRRICWKYCMSRNFVIDLCATLPLEWFVLGRAVDGGAEGVGGGYNLINQVRCNRLARAGGLFGLLDALTGVSLQRSTRICSAFRSKAFLTILQLFAKVLLVAHWLACCWYAVGIFSNDSITWLTFYTDFDSSSRVDQYVTSLYYIIGALTTVGYGDVRVTNNRETLFALILIPISTFVFSHFVATFDLLFDRHGSAAELRFRHIRFYLESNDIPPQLRRRIYFYFDFQWNKSKGIDDKAVLGELSPQLLADVKMSVNMNVVNSVPFFQECDIQFVKALTQVLEDSVFVPNDCIVRAGSVVRCMFFIQKGEVVMRSAHGYVTVLKQGDFFGEDALFGDCVSNSGFYAANFCQLLTLTKQKYEEVVEYFPHLEKVMVWKMKKTQETRSRRLLWVKVDDDVSEEDKDDDSSRSDGDSDEQKVVSKRLSLVQRVKRKIGSIVANRPPSPPVAKQRRAWGSLTGQTFEPSKALRLKEKEVDMVSEAVKNVIGGDKGKHLFAGQPSPAPTPGISPRGSPIPETRKVFGRAAAKAEDLVSPVSVDDTADELAPREMPVMADFVPRRRRAPVLTGSAISIDRVSPKHAVSPGRSRPSHTHHKEAMPSNFASAAGAKKNPKYGRAASWAVHSDVSSAVDAHYARSARPSSATTRKRPPGMAGAAKSTDVPDSAALHTAGTGANVTSRSGNLNPLLISQPNSRRPSFQADVFGF